MYRSHETAVRRWPALVPVIVLSLATGVALADDAPWAQPHSVRAGAYTLRASTVYSLAIPERIARANGITPAPMRGVLNVIVTEDAGNGGRNRQARVHAEARNLTGRKRDIPLHEILSNGQVSYLGTYDFVEGEVVDFTVDAVPLGTAQQLSLTFRDRLWSAK